MNDTENKMPVEAHGNNVVDIEAVARLFWNRGLQRFRMWNSGTEKTSDWPYTVYLSTMMDAERRVYWLESADPDLDASPVAIFNAHDDVFHRLEMIQSETMSRIPDVWVRKYLLSRQGR